MRVFWSLGALFAAGVTAVGSSAQDVVDHPLGEHQRTKVLYAGSPDGFREKVYVEFLGEWFAEVGVISLSDLDAKAAEPYDVVIADWRSWYGNDGYSKERVYHRTTLSRDFSKPVVMIGAVGGKLARKSKIGWL